jgi:hypothetical protein
MIYVYSAALVMIGVGCKCLLKLSKYEETAEEANWVVASALVTAFVCLNFFSILHNQTQVREAIAARCANSNKKSIANFLFGIVSLCGFVAISLAKMYPAPTLVRNHSFFHSLSPFLPEAHKN